MYYDRLKSRVRASNAARRRQQEAKALIDCIDVKQHIAPVYYPLHEDVKAGRHSTYNLPGGRGSCKSSFVSVEIVSGIMQDGESNAIVFRAVGNTLRDSCYSQIGWAIDTLGVSHLWRGRVSPMSYTSPHRAGNSFPWSGRCKQAEIHQTPARYVSLYLV